jgi:hypothetical protein
MHLSAACLLVAFLLASLPSVAQQDEARAIFWQAV